MDINITLSAEESYMIRLVINRRIVRLSTMLKGDIGDNLEDFTEERQILISALSKMRNQARS